MGKVKFLIAVSLLFTTMFVFMFLSCEGGIFGEKYNLGLSVFPVGAGVISCEPDLEEYSSGQTVTVTVSPNEGYEFYDWAGSKAGGANPLSFEITGGTAVEAILFSPMELDIVGKWRRYHSYDDSYHYIILNDDRTGCYFEIDSSDQRDIQYCYEKWMLDLDNPLSDTVYQLIYMNSENEITNDTDEYHSFSDELWRGGYSSLDYSKIDSSEWDCGCGF